MSRPQNLRGHSETSTPRAELAALRSARPRDLDGSVASLGMVVFDDDEPTRPDALAGDAAARDARDESRRRLYECIGRARDRLAAVQPALDRLSTSLRRPSDLPIELAVADVERRLVQARRSVRALAAELTTLDAEARDLIALAARGRR